jgi:hypothetical protein
MSKSRTRQRREKKQAASQSRNSIVGIVAVVGVIAIIAVVLLVRNSQLPDVDLGENPDESVTFGNLGQEHIPEGSPRPDYNSNPPTSGPHYAQWLPTGFYSQRTLDENLVHNLEHGHIWLSYRDADDTEAIEVLSAIQEQFPRWVIVTYRPENEDRIVVAAWTRLLPLETPDEDTILAFVTRFRNQAPESIAG